MYTITTVAIGMAIIGIPMLVISLFFYFNSDVLFKKKQIEFKKGPEMESRLFKRGDRVRCINSKNASFHLTYGAEYIVSQNQESLAYVTIFTGDFEVDVSPERLELLVAESTTDKVFKIGQEVFFITTKCNQDIQKDIIGLENRREFHLIVDQYKGVCISLDKDNVCVKVPVLDNFDLIVIPIERCFDEQADCDKFVDKMVTI